MNNLAIGRLIAAMLTISVLLTGCGTLNPANGTTQSDSGTGAIQTVPEDIQGEGTAVIGLDHLATYDYVLLMHGSSDSVVPLSYAERAADTYNAVEYYVIDGAGHGFSGRAFDEAIGHIFDYLQRIGFLQNGAA